MDINKILLLIGLILVSTILTNGKATAQGCGTYPVTDTLICLDHKGDRLPNNTACQTYASRIDPAPRLNTVQCPHTCCEQTHYIDGVAQTPTTTKRAGTCTDTYETTPVEPLETCEDRGDCPVRIPETCEDRGDCPADTCTQINILDGVATTEQKPAGTCRNTEACTPRTTTQDDTYSEPCQPISTETCRNVYDNPDRMVGLRRVCTTSTVATTGTQQVTRRRDVIRSRDCSTRYGNWAEISRTGTCTPVRNTSDPGNGMSESNPGQSDAGDGPGGDSGGGEGPGDGGGDGGGGNR